LQQRYGEEERGRGIRDSPCDEAPATGLFNLQDQVETKMRLLFSIILVIVAFFACYVEDIYLSFLPPQAGEVASFTVRSQRAFNFDQEKALGNYRKVALSRYVPLYTYVPDRVKEARQKMKALSAMASDLQDLNRTGEEELVEYLHKEFGLELRQDSALKLFRHPNFRNFLDGMLTIQDSILHNKIVEDPEPLKGKKSIEVRYPKPTGIVAHPTTELITLDEARLTMQKRVNQLFWRMDASFLDPLLQVSLATLLPNLNYDKWENERRIQEIIKRYPSKVISYKPRDILVPFRKVLSEEDVLLLAAYQKEGKKNLYGKAPWILIAIMFMVGLYNLFLSRILSPSWRKPPPYRLLIFLLITSIISSKACFLFTSFPIFAVPFAFLPLLMVLLHNEKVSTACTTVMGAMLVSLFAGRTFEILLFFTFSGMAALLVSFKVRKRIHILLPSLVVAIVNVAVFMAFAMDWESLAGLFGDWQKIGILSLTEILGNSSLEDAGWAFIGGLAAGPVAILLLPLLEVSLHTASTFKLNKYADLQHPLMRDLLTKAPATYQHTMTVAYLAQSVGEAIGANTPLLRIGAYYHDIGKMADPKLFTENQSDAENPHNDLGWQESANLIIQHVEHSEMLAREFGVPEVVVDLVSQHHGTQLVEYFYNKAVENTQGLKFDKENFRYPGPKPQSVEAAILMIADAVEAASRSMEKPTREKIEKMIRLLVVKRIADGQFDECNLSTRYLAKIVQTLVDSLAAALHSRVVYPWQERVKKASVARIEEKVRRRRVSTH
jgi:putative nucleotidyltransferase with HDIG domain